MPRYVDWLGVRDLLDPSASRARVQRLMHLKMKPVMVGRKLMVTARELRDFVDEIDSLIDQGVKVEIKDDTGECLLRMVPITKN